MLDERSLQLRFGLTAPIARGVAPCQIFHVAIPFAGAVRKTPAGIFLWILGEWGASRGGCRRRLDRHWLRRPLQRQQQMVRPWCAAACSMASRKRGAAAPASLPTRSTRLAGKRTIREQSPRILHGSSARVYVMFCRLLPATADKSLKNGGRCRD
jgi:hypothetical protein